MSASKQKRNRVAARSDGPDKKTAAAAEAAKKSKAYKVKAIITVVVIVVIIAAAAVINSDLFYTRTTAVQVGSTRYSPVELSFFFKSTFNEIYNNYYNSWGDTVSYLIDTSTPLDEQEYFFGSEGQTWADYIYEQTLVDLKQVTAYYDAAMKEGYTLTDDEKADVEENLQQIRDYVSSSDSFSSVNQYLATYYGKGMTEKRLTSLAGKVAIASRYAQDLQNSFTYTSEELNAYYDEHADEMDYYNYYSYMISASNTVFDELADDDAKNQAAHDAAEAIAAAKDVEDYYAKVDEFSEGDSESLYISHYTRSDLENGFDSAVSTWVTDAAREPGDADVVDIDGASYAILFLGKDNNDYNTVDMRHILIQPEADENGSYTDEALEAAKSKAELLLDAWKGDPTADNFAMLANANSDDSGSNENGGLYEQVPKNYMVEPINDFLFDPNVKEGDTTVVFYDGSYTGYHVVYRGADNTPNKELLADNAMRAEDTTAASDALTSQYEVTTGAGLRYANLK